MNLLRNAVPACALGFTAGLLAQHQAALHPAGLTYGTPPAGVNVTSYGTRTGAEVLFRIPGEAYRGIGTYVPPNLHRVLGAVLQLSDATLAEGELFDVHVYLEVGQTNLPTITGPDLPGTTAVASVRDLTTPPGIGSHSIEVLFPQPVLVPIGSDVFLSIHLRTPGLRVSSLLGTGLRGIITSAIDSCGPGLAAGEYFSLLHDLGTLSPQGSATVGVQPLFDLLVEGATGVGVARIATGSPPTASFYSGLHPDSATPSYQPNRHDLPGYVFRSNGTLDTDSPVFLLGSTQPFASQPWIVLSPGNAILHLAPVGLVGLTMTLVDALGEATMFWPVPPTSAIRGLEIRTQAFGFNVATGSVASGAAVRQRF